MARTDIKMCKKALRAGVSATRSNDQVKAARQAAIFLLQRSVQMKHKQLTLVRLLEALKLHAPIDEMLWQHCMTVAKVIASTQELRMLYALRQQAVYGDN